jgi:SAM-dependent methyltransferase
LQAQEALANVAVGALHIDHPRLASGDVPHEPRDATAAHPRDPVGNCVGQIVRGLALVHRESFRRARPTRNSAPIPSPLKRFERASDAWETLGGNVEGDGLRLHLGCGATTPAGWVNVDGSLGARLAKWRPLRPLLRALGVFAIDWDPSIVVHDLRRPLPWPDRAAAAIYSCHTLEHLSRDDGRRLLHECRRVLRPGGVIRIAVPDVAQLIGEYEKGVFPAVELVERMGVAAEEPGDGPWKRRLAPLFRFPHRCMYDGDSLLAAMAEAGLKARLHPAFVSRLPDVSDVEPPERMPGSVIAEAVRGAG